MASLKHSSFSSIVVSLCVAGLGLVGCAIVSPHQPNAKETSAHVQATYLQTPLHFEANEGQTDGQVKFLSRGSGYGLYLTPQEAVLALRKPKPSGSEQETEETSPDSAVLRMRLVGANATPELTGDNLLPGKVNYFIGNDPAKWRTQIPTYGKIRYDNVYPGIDLLYYGNQRQLEYDFIVAPGEDPAQIAMAFEGTERLELDTQTGDLVLQTASGEVRQRKPLIYQEGEGDRQTIEGQYVINDTHVGFHVATYDTTKPLIIDPILVFSTFLGGSGIDNGNGIALNGGGQITVTGWTETLDFPGFPSLNPLQPTIGGTDVVFITQFTADGSALVFSTYLGGSDSDQGNDIAVDGMGYIYVTGSTHSTNFPTKNAVQPNLAVEDGVAYPPGPFGNPTDAFVAQLSPDGSALIFSTYLGGSRDESGNGIAVDGNRKIYVTGDTNSTNFPIQNAFQPTNGGGGGFDAFIAKFNSNGSSLAYATFLGGGNYDVSKAIAVDEIGQASVTGLTRSANFPTKNAFQPFHGEGGGNGTADAFVAQLTADGSALNYSTFLGGSDLDIGNAIAIDGWGRVSITGRTFSENFPTKNAFQQFKNPTLVEEPCPVPGAPPNLPPCFRPQSDAFMAQLTRDGSALAYATYFGGGNDDQGTGIAINSRGEVLIIGLTGKTEDFPIKNPFSDELTGWETSFLSQFSTDGSTILFSSFLGGEVADGGLAVNKAGQAYITGGAANPGFPTVNPIQPVRGSPNLPDAFVAKIDPLRDNLNDKFSPLGPGDVSTSFSRTPCGGASAGTFTITASFTNTSANTLSNLLISVKTLTGGNMLCNANGGPGGAGAILTVPLQGDLSDSQLSPGETFTVQLAIGLQSFTPFQFLVDVLGEKD
ncbi:MAG: SBBP repeat-containing protein [Nitrospiraceae bacterium]|nr:SBBP repeat-containing protein [Nitrospiraceae bacterium]